MYDRGTILFVDEVASLQQSAAGCAAAVGRERDGYPSSAPPPKIPTLKVNKALVSRSRIFQLKSLTEQHLRHIMQAALKTPGRGYGDRRVFDRGGGGGRTSRFHRQWRRPAPFSTRSSWRSKRQTRTRPARVRINLAIAEESRSNAALVLYDKEGDYHFDTISAFIKSLRWQRPGCGSLLAGEDDLRRRRPPFHPSAAC